MSKEEILRLGTDILLMRDSVQTAVLWANMEIEERQAMGSQKSLKLFLSGPILWSRKTDLCHDRQSRKKVKHLTSIQSVISSWHAIRIYLVSFLFKTP